MPIRKADATPEAYEAHLEYHRQWRRANRDKLKTYVKKYWETRDQKQYNKQRYEQLHGVPVVCEGCGRSVKRSSLSRHVLSKIHLAHVADTQKNNEEA